MNGVCKSCGARITWARTDAGKSMPVDADPHPDGTIAIIADRVCFSVPLECGDVPRYRSHFATCPNPDEHRNSR